MLQSTRLQYSFRGLNAPDFTSETETKGTERAGSSMDRLFGNRRNDNKREREKETGRKKKTVGDDTNPKAREKKNIHGKKIEKEEKCQSLAMSRGEVLFDRK